MKRLSVPTTIGPTTNSRIADCFRPSGWLAAYSAVFCLLIDVSSAFARHTDEYGFQEEPERNFFYEMIQGKFGAFLIVFMGFGGVATLFMTRQGKSSTKVPVLGILMLVVAAFVFFYRVTINAGLHGAEHIKW